MGWRGYIDTSHRTVFFWSQKSACTTLFSFLGDNMDERPQSKHFFHTNSQPYQPCLQAVRKNKYRAVILARHPVTRSISAYFNKFCTYRVKSLKNSENFEPFAKDLHDLFCQIRGVHTDDNIMSFEDFLATVQHLHTTRRKKHLPVNGHWDTQVPAFLAKKGFRYDQVIHVENLDDELGALAQELNMVFHPRRMNQTETTENQHQGYLGDVPAHKIADYAFGYENFITPRTLARIHDIYAVDFRTLGYPLEPTLQ